MDYKKLLGRLWRTNKLALLTAVYNIVILGINTVLRLGRIIKPIFNRRVVEGELKFTHLRLMVELQRPLIFSLRMLSSNSTEETAKLFTELTLVKAIYVQDVMVVFGIDNLGKAHIVIRGTVDIENWADNINADMQWDSKIHTVVHDGYKEIADEIARHFSIYLIEIENDTDPEKLIVQGYSMGGGLAVLTALYLEKLIEIEKVYSIAGPKVVFYDYGKLPVTHVMHEQDPIPYLPVWTLLTPYRHQGERILITKDDIFIALPDSFRTDIYSSLWMLRNKLNLSAHTSYGKYIAKDK